MIYRAIGVMSGSSLDGLDIAFVEFTENGGKWSFEVLNTACYSYSPAWATRLQTATSLSAVDYQLLHAEYGHYLGEQINKFIDEHQLHYKVAVVASHGHTSFHLPAKKMTAQLGDGAAIAAVTQLPVVSDLRNLDVALGGQGAPIVPIGEKLLWSEYDYYLNLGGIANISVNDTAGYKAFDVCPANRVLNMLAAKVGKEYDKNGELAAEGKKIQSLFDQLNELAYYSLPFPKSLSNEFGTEVIYPIIEKSGCSVADSLRTYCEHIVAQIASAISAANGKAASSKLLVSGGGALNSFLVSVLKDELSKQNIQVVLPDETIVNYKEAIVMALIGVLRWRQEYNVFSSVTGASRDSVGGALWMGQEA